MGTRGLRIYYSAGFYYTSYIPCDAYPEGWGLRILRDMPHGQEDTPEEEVKFSEWVYDKRRWLEGLRMERNKLKEQGETAQGTLEPEEGLDGDVESEPGADDEDVYLTDYIDGLQISRTKPRHHPDFEYIYELDFDSLTFLVNHFPLFNMSHMPPANRFVQWVGHDHYGHRACAPTTPKRHRYSCKTAAPPVEDASLLIDYQVLGGDREPVDIHKLISARPTPTHVERIRLRMLETLIGSCLTYLEYGYLLRAPPTLDSRAQISPLMAAIMNYFIFLAAVPMVYCTDYGFGRYKYSISIDKTLDIMWPRRNICSMLWTHLDDEPTLRAAIVHLTREAVKDKDKDRPSIVYGIVFSGVHIGIVRIDRANGGAFTHTPALQFLPSWYATSPSTPGITALGRLCCLQGDTLYSRQVLKNSWYPKGRAEKAEARWKQMIQFRDGGLLERLPTEILGMIADNFLDDRTSLLMFSRICPRSAAVSAEALNYVYVGEYRLTNVIDLPQTRHELSHGCFDAVSLDGEPVRLHLGRPRFRSRLTGKLGNRPLTVRLPEFLSDFFHRLQPHKFFLFIADTSKVLPNKGAQDGTEIDEDKAEVTEDTAEVAEDTMDVAEDTMEVAEDTVEVAEDTAEIVEAAEETDGGEDQETHAGIAKGGLEVSENETDEDDDNYKDEDSDEGTGESESGSEEDEEEEHSEGEEENEEEENDEEDEDEEEQQQEEQQQEGQQQKEPEEDDPPSPFIDEYCRVESLERVGRDVLTGMITYY